MPRSLRRFAEGGIYHVYNRFSSGVPVFADPEEALEVIELLRYVKRRDDWTVFAWVVMSNHYHLAIRNRATPINGQREGVRQRLEDDPFRQRYEELDRLLIGEES